TGVTVNALHPASLMPTKMVRESFGYTMSTIADGLEATRRLVIAPELDGVSGRYFDRLEEGRAEPQAYDPAARRRLGQLSEELVDPVAPHKGTRALLRVGLPPLHRHPAVAETAAVRLDAPRRAVPAVDGEAMLVSPEPQDGLRHVGAQLSRRVVIAVVERGVVLVVGEQHDTTVGQERSDDDAEPLEQPIFQRTRRLDPGELPEEGNLAQDREPLGVVSGVQADHRPILVEQAEEAGPLPARSTGDGIQDAVPRQEPVEVRVPVRVHLVVAGQGEAAVRSQGPRDRR